MQPLPLSVFNCTYHNGVCSCDQNLDTKVVVQVWLVGPVGIDYLRGVFKKFAAQQKRKTNFTTKRGVRDVTLLKRPLTQPLANRSCCFAQAVGCCKNVCYFCRTQRRSASGPGYSLVLAGMQNSRKKEKKEAVIRFVVLQKSVARVIDENLLATPGEDYLPYRSVKVRIKLFKAGRQSIEDDLHSGRPPAAVSEENVEEVGHLVMNELQCWSETTQRKCRYMMHPPKQFSFGI